jgi:hypothetical protein
VKVTATLNGMASVDKFLCASDYFKATADGMLKMTEGFDRIKNMAFNRVNLICKVVNSAPKMPCEKCHKDNCEGINECEGYGSFSLGISAN